VTLSIGGSEIGIIAGVGFRSSHWLYSKLRGECTAPDEETEPLYWGRALEAAVADRYARDHGVSFVEPNPLPATTIPLGSHLARASPDRLIAGQRKGLEIKTANAWSRGWGDPGPGAGRVPQSYELQVRWYLGVLGYDEWDLAVLIGGQDYREYQFARDTGLEQAIFGLAERFLDRTAAGVPPPADGSDDCADALQRRFGPESGETIRATPEVAAIAYSLRDARSRREAAEEEESIAKNKLRELIGSARGIEGDNWRAIWYTVHHKGKTDWESVALQLGAREHPEIVGACSRPASTTRAFRADFKEDK
jgi:putative phage-type endonuclease